MSNDQYYTVIIFVIDVAIICKNRPNSGILPVLFEDTHTRTLEGILLMMTFADEWEIFVADSFNITTSIPNIPLLDLLG